MMTFIVDPAIYVLNFCLYGMVSLLSLHTLYKLYKMRNLVIMRNHQRTIVVMFLLMVIAACGAFMAAQIHWLTSGLVMELGLLGNVLWVAYDYTNAFSYLLFVLGVRFYLDSCN